MKTRYIIALTAVLLTLSSLVFGYTPFGSESLQAPTYTMRSTSVLLPQQSPSMALNTVGATSPTNGPWRMRKGDPDPDYDPEDDYYEPGTPTVLTPQLPIGDGMWFMVILAVGYSFFIAWKKRRVNSEE